MGPNLPDFDYSLASPIGTIEAALDAKPPGQKLPTASGILNEQAGRSVPSDRFQERVQINTPPSIKLENNGENLKLTGSIQKVGPGVDINGRPLGDDAKSYSVEMTVTDLVTQKKASVGSNDPNKEVAYRNAIEIVKTKFNLPQAFKIPEINELTGFNLISTEPDPKKQVSTPSQTLTEASGPTKKEKPGFFDRIGLLFGKGKTGQQNETLQPVKDEASVNAASLKVTGSEKNVESVAETFVKSSDVPTVSTQSVAQDLVGAAQPNTPTKTVSQESDKAAGKLSDADFNQMIELARYKEAEKLRQKETEVIAKLKSGEPLKPSESVAAGFAPEKKTEITSSSVATNFVNSSPGAAQTKTAQPAEKKTDVNASSEPSQIGADSIASTFVSAQDPDAMLEAYLNTGLSSEELANLSENQKRGADVEKALNDRKSVEKPASLLNSEALIQPTPQEKPVTTPTSVTQAQANPAPQEKPVATPASANQANLAPQEKQMATPAAVTQAQANPAPQANLAPQEKPVTTPALVNQTNLAPQEKPVTTPTSVTQANLAPQEKPVATPTSVSQTNPASQANSAPQEKPVTTPAVVTQAQANQAPQEKQMATSASVTKKPATDFFSFYESQRKSIQEKVQTEKAAISKTETASTAGTAGTAGVNSTSGQISPESVARNFVSDEEMEADAILEAYLNTGLSSEELNTLSENQKKGSEFEKALNARTSVAQLEKPLNSEETSEKEIPEKPSAVTQAANSPTKKIDEKSKSAEVTVSNQSIATDFAKSDSGKESIATAFVGPKTEAESIATAFVGPIAPAGPAATVSAQASSKLANEDFNDLVELARFKDAEGLRKKEEELSRKLKAGGEPPKPSESVAGEFKVEKNAATLSAESIASDFAEEGSTVTVANESVATDLAAVSVSPGNIESSDKPPVLPAAAVDLAKPPSEEAMPTKNEVFTRREKNSEKIQNAADETNQSANVKISKLTPGETVLEQAKEDKPPKKKGFFAKIKEFFTGKDKDSEKIESAPDASNQSAAEISRQSANAKMFGLTPEEKERVDKGLPLYDDEDEDEFLEDSDIRAVDGENLNISKVLNPADAAQAKAATEITSTSVIKSEVNSGKTDAGLTGPPTIANVVNGGTKSNKTPDANSEPAATVQNGKPLTEATKAKINEPDRSVERAVSGLGTKIVESSEGISGAVTGAVKEMVSSQANGASVISNSTINNQNSQMMASSAGEAQPAVQAGTAQEERAQPSTLTSDHYIRLLYEAIVVHGVKLKSV